MTVEIAEGTKDTPLRFYDEAEHQKLVRKAKREQWQRIVYHSRQGGVRNGWLIHETRRGKKTVRLIGDLQNRHLNLKESEFVRLV